MIWSRTNHQNADLDARPRKVRMWPNAPRTRQLGRDGASPLVEAPLPAQVAEHGVEAGKGLAYTARVIQRQAGSAQAGDAEAHRDAVVAAAFDLGGLGCAGPDLDPVRAGCDLDTEPPQVDRAGVQPVGLL